MSTLVASLSMAGCAVIHPPAPYLPSRASITPGQTVSVRGNQNVYAIARENNVSMRDIIVLNDLRAPFTLKAGQQLTLPASAKPSIISGYTRSTGDASSKIAESSPQLSGAANFGSGISTTAVEQAELPPISTQSASLTLPQASATNMPLADKPLVGQSPSSFAVLSSSPPHTAATGVLEPAPSAAEMQEGVNAVDEAHAELVWPVQGPVLSKFGPKGQGLSNDGLNISAPKGAPVIAAANGIVVYSGSDIKGFGNLILIRHQGGMVTAYAHLDRAMVNKDTVVAQGDMIGTVGKTGSVPSPQLHFEVRSQGKPVDPEKYLKAFAPDKATQG